MKYFFKFLFNLFQVFIILIILSCANDAGDTPNELTKDISDNKTSAESQTYTIRYSSELGTVPETITVKTNSILTDEQLPILEAEDHEFSGWFDGNEKVIAGSYKVTKDVLLEGKWDIKIVTFNTDGGSEVVSQIIKIGTKVTQPSKPTKVMDKTSYAFLGWYNDNSVFDFETPVSSDLTLTAHWLEGFVEVEGMTVTNVVANSVNFTGEAKTIVDLYVCDHEVTQKEYRKYCRYDDTNYYANYYYHPTENYGLGDNYPAYCVSWYDAIVYCNLRSMAESLEPVYIIYNEKDPSKWAGVRSLSEDGITKYCGLKTGDDRPEQSVFDEWNKVTMDNTANGYRLPHFKEWEYVARDGKEWIYKQPNYARKENLSLDAWYDDGNGYPKCREIKGKNPNSLGIYDIVGNIAEFCNDWAKNNVSSSLGGAKCWEIGTQIYEEGIRVNTVSHTACGCSCSNSLFSFYPDTLSCYNSIGAYTRTTYSGFRIVRSK